MFASLFQFKRNRKQKQFGKKIKEILGYSPGNFRLYEIALIHKSASLRLDDGSLINNERLEYLGDAILSSIAADYLFRTFPQEDEGFLTEMRSKIVNREALNNIATKLGLSNLIISKVSDTASQNFKGDAFEALIGAIFLDRGFKKTRKYVIKQIINEFLDLEYLQRTDTNYKSKIIEWSQKTKQDISFESFEVPNDNRSNPAFMAHLLVLDKVIGTGRGSSKKEAEQQAAKEALTIIGQIN